MVKTATFTCFEMFAHCGGQLAHLIRKISAQREFHPFFLTNLERDKIKMIFQNVVGATLCRPQKSSPKRQKSINFSSQIERYSAGYSC